MAEFPALPLWTDAYLADTRHLSTLEHGAYLLLLMEAWRRPHCDLPDDDRILARLAGLTAAEWEDVKPIVMDLWTFDGRSKTWKQKRLTDERSYVKKKSRSQKDKAAKRWNKTKTDDAAALPEECRDDAPTPTPTSNTLETDVSNAADAAEADRSSDLNGAGSPIPPSAIDITKAVFDTGVRILTSFGKSDPQARSMIGRWRRDFTDGAVLAVFSRCEREAPSNPIEWITKALQAEARKAAGNGHGNPTGKPRDGAVAELERRAAARHAGQGSSASRRSTAHHDGEVGQLSLAPPPPGGPR